MSRHRINPLPRSRRHGVSRKPRWKIVTSMLASLAMVVGMAAVGGASAATPSPTVFDGNVQCTDAGYGFSYDSGIKLDKGTPGTYSYASGSWQKWDSGQTVAPTGATVTVTIDEKGSADHITSFSYAAGADPAIAGILVKASNQTELFDAPVADTTLTISIAHDISHISFCYNAPDTSSGTPVVTVTKTLVEPGPFNPTDTFQYKVQYTCSSLDADCPNAVVTDTIPDELDFVSHTSTGDPSTITYDSATRKLTVTFLSLVTDPTTGNATQGLKAGTTGQFLLTVKFPNGTVDGTTAKNCAQITADGAATPDPSCATATARTTPGYGVNLTKKYIEPFTGETATSGVVGSDATTTLNLAATVDGNQPATSVTVVDPDPSETTNNDPFDSFNLVEFNTLDLPSGVQATIQVKSTGAYQTVGTFTDGDAVALPGDSGIDAENVTGIKVGYTRADGSPITAGTALSISAKVQLRDAQRSSSADAVPAGTVHNQAKVTATYSNHGDETDTDTADYTVVSQSADVTPSKTIKPTSALAGSGAKVTMAAGGTNSGNVDATSMTVTDGPKTSTGSTPWADTFTFTKFDPLTLPSGVTAEAWVFDSSANSGAGGWVRLGSSYGNSATPTLTDADPDVSAANVTGVRWIYTGNIPAGTSITNAFTTTLKDSATSGDINDANCASASLVGAGDAGNATEERACADFTVGAVEKKVRALKSFNPGHGVAQTGATTTVKLSGENDSNVALSQFQLVEPGTGTGNKKSDASFDYFTFTGFGEIHAPGGTTWTVEVSDGSNSSWNTVGTYSPGDTPSSSGMPITASAVEGVRYTLASGSIPAHGDDTFTTTIDLQLRDTIRDTQIPIDSGSVKNCETVTSVESVRDDACATYTIDALDPGTGTGISKNIHEDSVLQGTTETTWVTLKAGNNDANVVANKVVIEDSPDTNTTSPEFWDSFGFTEFGAVGWPSGTMGLAIQYYDGSTWQHLGSYTSQPSGSTLDTALGSATVKGLKYTWTGNFPAKTTGFTVKFKVELDPQAAASIGQGIKNCMAETYDGPLYTSPVTESDCDWIKVVARTYKVHQTKTFSPTTGVVGLSSTTTATLTVKNSGTAPLSTIVVTDPDSTHNPFDKFDLTGFGKVSISSGGSDIRVTVQTSTDGGTTWTTVTDGSGKDDFANTVQIPTPANPGEVDAVKFTVHPTNGSIIPAGLTVSVPLKLQLRDTVRSGESAVDTAGIVNCFATTATYGEQGTVTSGNITGDPCATFTPQAQGPGVSDQKSWNPSTGVRDELPTSTITIKGRNSGNVPATSLVLQDPAATWDSAKQSYGALPALAETAFDAFNVTGFTGLVFPKGADQVQIDVLTADGAWHNGAPSTTLPSGADVNGVQWGDIVGVRATFTNSSGGTLPVETNATKTGNVGINVQLRPTLRSTGAAINVTPGGSVTIDNASSAVINTDYGNTAAAPAIAQYTITGGNATMAPNKSLYPQGTPTEITPNQTLVYQLQITNNGDRNLVAPIVLDKFDAAELAYDSTQAFPAGGYGFAPNGSSLTGTGMTVDDSTPGQVRFTFADGDYLAPGETAYIRIVLTAKPGIAAGTSITNEYGVTWDVQTNGVVQCSGDTESSDFDGQASWCVDDQIVSVLKAESMASLKQIKGDPGVPFTNLGFPGLTCPDDAGYTYYPCIAHTHTDGVFDYKLNVTVSGNVAIGQARVIDVLPHVGDTGVILTDQTRGSEWTPTMHSVVTVSGLPSGLTYQVYYATNDPTSVPPNTAPLSNGGGVWTTGGYWSATVPADLSTVTAIGIEVFPESNTPDASLQPADTFTLHWTMQAPSVAPGVGSIAWNSFAYSGLPTDGSGWLQPAEPRKVGIDLTNPSVTVSKTSEGADGSFDFTLTQGYWGDDNSFHPSLGEGDESGFSNTQTVQTSREEGDTEGHSSFTWGPPSFTLEPGGWYSLGEAPSARWTSEFAQCTNVVIGDNGKPTNQELEVSTLDDGSVVFRAPANGQITCSFTNTFVPPPPPPEPQEVTPAVAQSQCVLEGESGLVTASTVAVEGISYTIVGNGTEKVVITATATDGYTLIVPDGWTDLGGDTATITLTPESLLCVGGESSTVPPSSTTGADAVGPTTSIEVLGESEDIAYTGVPAYRMGWIALMLLVLGGVFVGISTKRGKARKH